MTGPDLVQDRAGRLRPSSCLWELWDALRRSGCGQVVRGLEVDPEIWSRPEGASQEPGGLRRNAPLATHKLVDTLNWYAQVHVVQAAPWGPR